MISKPVIVGCGTVGATLALQFSKEKLISDLRLYDNDVVSYSGNSSNYPFLKEEAGLPKVQIIEFLCKLLHKNIRIQAIQKKITSPLSVSNFIIDCRDCKLTDVGANLRISLDGHMLYLDSMHKTNPKNYSYHRYVYPRNEIYIKKAIDIVVDYLNNDEYIFHNLKLYNLKQNDSYILEGDL